MKKPIARDHVVYKLNWVQVNTEPRTLDPTKPYIRMEVTKAHYDNLMASDRTDYITESDYNQLKEDGFVKAEAPKPVEEYKEQKEKEKAAEAKVSKSKKSN